MLKVKQIGNGGGLDVNKTNTSFVLMENDKPFALIDCGFNIPAKLEELDYTKDIEYVFITHKHMDHIGGLESLIYLRYFKYGLHTTLVIDEMVFEDIGYSFFDHFNTIKDNNDSSRVNMVEIQIKEFERDVSNRGCDIINKYFNIETYGLIGQHGNVVNVGYIFTIDKTAIVFTGDTNATLNIRDIIHELCMNYDKVVVYHDYSEWDNPVENPHCCESEFKIYLKLLTEYSDKLTIHKVHDGSDKLIEESYE